MTMGKVDGGVDQEALAREVVLAGQEADVDEVERVERGEGSDRSQGPGPRRVGVDESAQERAAQPRHGAPDERVGGETSPAEDSGTQRLEQQGERADRGPDRPGDEGSLERPQRYERHCRRSAPKASTTSRAASQGPLR